MSSGFLALLDDISLLARTAATSLDDIATGAAASLDDVAAGAVKAGTKATGLVIDDAAVTPKYVSDFTSDRELPIIGRITLGSLRNKLLFLLPMALLLSALAPWALTPLLMLGGLYLSFEGAEKVIEVLFHAGHAKDEARKDEAETVRSAIRTDFILSAEIMTLTLASVTEHELHVRALVLALVGVAITFAVYGAVALIVRADDVGLRLARRGTGLLARIGRGLVSGMPRFLALLSIVGTAAMLWVGGGILVHGAAELGFHIPEHLIHNASHTVSHHLIVLPDATSWITGAALSGITGISVGAILISLIAGGRGMARKLRLEENRTHPSKKENIKTPVEQILLSQDDMDRINEICQNPPEATPHMKAAIKSSPLSDLTP